MPSRIVPFIAVLALIAFSGCRGDDKSKLQGTWKAEKAVERGNDVSAEKIEKMILRFEGDKVIPYEGEKEEGPGSYTIDSSKSPREIDVTPPKGNEKTMLGIYEVSGDSLKLCFNQDGTRPTNFESKEGSKTMVIEFRRVKK